MSAAAASPVAADSEESSVPAAAASAAAAAGSEEHSRRDSVLSETELRWSEEQRKLRGSLVTTDEFAFSLDASAAAASGASAASSAGAAAAAAASSVDSGSKPGLSLVGGVDISFWGEGSEEACAALVVLQYPSMRVVYEDYEVVRMEEPYIAGFLAFREVAHLTRLISRLRLAKPHLLPQVILVDGNGLLHHRGFGLACHLGVLVDIPTVGVSKNLLLVDGLDKAVVLSRAAAELKKGGESFDLVGVSGQVWGSCLRSTAASSNPIFVSIGHRISLATATQLVHACCQHRIPEPVRCADLRSREFIRKAIAKGGSAPAAAAAR